MNYRIIVEPMAVKDTAPDRLSGHNDLCPPSRFV
jgi:hypothetical protein